MSTQHGIIDGNEPYTTHPIPSKIVYNIHSMQLRCIALKGLDYYINYVVKLFQEPNILPVSEPDTYANGH